jgi:hypothetical protein
MTMLRIGQKKAGIPLPRLLSISRPTFRSGFESASTPFRVLASVLWQRTDGRVKCRVRGVNGEEIVTL